MRTMVAGGAGFIGAHMCARLLDRGDEVVCVDNLVTGSARNVEELAGRPRFTFVEADISHSVPDPGARLDGIINLACPASPVDFESLSLEILSVGSVGLAHLLELAREHDARILQASTSEVYGEPGVHPQPETYWGHVNPVGPRSVYDEAKRFGESMTMAYRRRFGIDVRIARIFNTYGPRMRVDDGRIISTFVTQALAGAPLTVHGDGSQTRSFCYVDDEVTGLLALFDSDYREPVNIGNEHEMTVLSLAELVIALTGSASQVVFKDRPVDDPSQRRPDLTVARTVLGWEPTIAVEEGLRRTISWFRDHLDP
jgi:nucleoside-diphosphate-sugar epimerase